MTISDELNRSCHSNQKRFAKFNSVDSLIQTRFDSTNSLI